MRIITLCAGGKRVDCCKMARLNSALPPFFWLLTFFLAQLFHPRFVYRTTERLRNRKRTADCAIDNGYEKREWEKEKERDKWEGHDQNANSHAFGHVKSQLPRRFFFDNFILRRCTSCFERAI